MNSSPRQDLYILSDTDKQLQTPSGADETGAGLYQRMEGFGLSSPASAVSQILINYLATLRLERNVSSQTS